MLLHGRLHDERLCRSRPAEGSHWRSIPIRCRSTGKCRRRSPLRRYWSTGTVGRGRDPKGSPAGRSITSPHGNRRCMIPWPERLIGQLPALTHSASVGNACRPSGHTRRPRTSISRRPGAAASPVVAPVPPVPRSRLPGLSTKVRPPGGSSDPRASGPDSRRRSRSRSTVRWSSA